MNNNEHDNKLEQRIRFVAKRYREGSLDSDKAWQKFASEPEGLVSPVLDRGGRCRVSARRSGDMVYGREKRPGLGCDYYRPRTNERCLPSG